MKESRDSLPPWLQRQTNGPDVFIDSLLQAIVFKYDDETANKVDPSRK